MSESYIKIRVKQDAQIKEVFRLMSRLEYEVVVEEVCHWVD